MSNSISNKIGKLIEVDWKKDLIELQPEDVKVKINHEYLKESLLKHGFALPFFVWNNNGQYYCIDGHTRKEVLEEMVAEGIEVPKKLKALEIVCKNKKEAIDILVSVYNQKQNQFNEEVLMQWLETEEVEVELLESVNIKYSYDVDADLDEFFTEDEPKEDETTSQSFKITLDYTEEDYAELTDALAKIGGSKEDVFYNAIMNYVNQ